MKHHGIGIANNKLDLYNLYKPNFVNEIAMELG